MKCLLLCFLVLGVCFLPAQARAFGSMQEQQPLAFGVLAVTGTAQKDLVLDTDGNYAPSHPGFTVLHAGSAGVYRMYDYAPNLPMELTIDNTKLTRTTGSPEFDVISFTFDPPDPEDWVTDGSGELIVKIGATLRAQGGVTYPAGSYRGTYTLMLNF